MGFKKMVRGLAAFSSMTAVSRVFGLARDVAIATTFGATWESDAFAIAFRIPNFLRRLFAEGSFGTAFIPVLMEARDRTDRDGLRRIISNIAGVLAAVVGSIVVLGMLNATTIASLFAGASNPAKVSLISELLRLTFPFLLFVSLAALLGGALNSEGKFGLPALTPVILNICLVIACFLAAANGKVSVTYLGWAVMVGGLIQLLVLGRAVARIGLLGLPTFGLRSYEVRKTSRLMLPTLVGSSVAQINLLFDTALASALFVGSQTWLSQADRFLELPLGLFGVALSTVILPALASHYARSDVRGFQSTISWAVRTSLLISIPACVALLCISHDIVVALFQYGRFRAFDSRMVSASVTCLSIGLPAFALIKVLLPAFYARQDASFPMRVGLIAVVSNVALSCVLLLISYVANGYGEASSVGFRGYLETQPGLHVTLGVASAMSSYINLALLSLELYRRGVLQVQSELIVFVVKVLASSIGMASVLILMKYLAGPVTSPHSLVRILWVLALCSVGGLTFVCALYAMGIRIASLSRDDDLESPKVP